MPGCINSKERQFLKESQYLYKCPGKQYIYMHQVIYNNKLKHKCTLIPLDPRLLYIGLYMLRGTFPLGIPVWICTAACLYYIYYIQLHILLLFVLCGVGQLLTRTRQCQAAFNAHNIDFSVIYIIFVLFCDHIYQNYIVLLYIQAIRRIILTFYTLKTLKHYNLLNIYMIETK